LYFWRVAGANAASRRTLETLDTKARRAIGRIVLGRNPPKMQTQTTTQKMCGKRTKAAKKKMRRRTTLASGEDGDLRVGKQKKTRRDAQWGLERPSNRGEDSSKLEGVDMLWFPPWRRYNGSPTQLGGQYPVRITRTRGQT
jgi:hypothetical protein